MNPVLLVGIGVILLLISPIREFGLIRLKMRSGAPLAFTIANRRQFTDPLSLAAVGTELGEHASVFSSEPAVTADADGISFWDRTPHRFAGILPWSSISRIEPARLQTPFRRLTPYAIVLTVAVGVAEFRVPLLSPNSRRNWLASAADVAAIAAALEALRLAALP